ncbi:hypothetical protein IL306_007204 [Fusarium sp. DS 682]|nr:hypothetical protein IL306_007204 [Fusarium sp. DS 682]
MADNPKPNRASQITFKVMALPDSNHDITMDDTETVFDLRSKLAEALGETLVDQALLLFSGRVIENDKTLSDYKIKRSNIVYLISQQVPIKELGYSDTVIRSSGLQRRCLYQRLMEIIQAIDRGDRPITTETPVLQRNDYIRDWWLSPPTLAIAIGLLFRAKKIDKSEPNVGWATGDLYVFKSGSLELLKKETEAALPASCKIYSDGKYYLGKESSGLVIRKVADWSIVNILEASSNQKWEAEDLFLVCTTWTQDEQKIEVWDPSGTERLGEVVETGLDGYQIIKPMRLVTYGHKVDKDGFLNIWDLQVPGCVKNYPLTKGDTYGDDDDDDDDHVKTRLVELGILPTEGQPFHQKAVDLMKSSDYWEAFPDGTVLALDGKYRDYVIVTPEGDVITEPNMAFKSKEGKYVEEENEEIEYSFWLGHFIVSHLSPTFQENGSQGRNIDVLKISSSTGKPLVRIETQLDGCTECYCHFDPCGRIIVSLEKDLLVHKIIAYDFCKQDRAKQTSKTS